MKNGGSIYQSILFHMMFNFWGTIISGILPTGNSTLFFVLYFATGVICTFSGLILFRFGTNRLAQKQAAPLYLEKYRIRYFLSIQLVSSGYVSSFVTMTSSLFITADNFFRKRIMLLHLFLRSNTDPEIIADSFLRKIPHKNVFFFQSLKQFFCR